MKTRFIVIAAITVLLVNAVVLAAPDTRRKTAKQRTVARLVSLLPASDGVAALDAKRFFGEALPRIMSSNQPMLDEMTAKLNEMQARMGIDLRKFEQVAVGIEFRQISPKEVDFVPVAIATGDLNAGALINIARMASNGTYRETTVAGKTVYIFAAADFQKTSAANTANSKLVGIIDSALRGFTRDVAVTTLDANTLVMGPLDRVTAALEARTRVAADIASLVLAKDTAFLSFAAKPAGGMSALLPIDADQFGKNIDSIVMLSGSMEVAAAGAALQAVARTKTAQNAQELKLTLDGLKSIGSAVFGNSKRADQQVYGRLLNAARIDVRGTDVSLDVVVAQADIATLVGK